MKSWFELAIQKKTFRREAWQTFLSEGLPEVVVIRSWWNFLTIYMQSPDRLNDGLAEIQYQYPQEQPRDIFNCSRMADHGLETIVCTSLILYPLPNFRVARHICHKTILVITRPLSWYIYIPAPAQYFTIIERVTVSVSERKKFPYFSRPRVSSRSSNG